MAILGYILVTVAILGLIFLFVVAIVCIIRKNICKCKKLVNRALYKELLKRCGHCPNQPVKLELNGDMIFVRFVPNNRK